MVKVFETLAEDGVIRLPADVPSSAHCVVNMGGVFILGRTAKGRATVAALQLNDAYHQSARSVRIIAGIYPPE